MKTLSVRFPSATCFEVCLFKKKNIHKIKIVDYRWWFSYLLGTKFSCDIICALKSLKSTLLETNGKNRISLCICMQTQ